MRSYTLILLLISSFKAIAQKDNSDNSMPLFYKSDPAIYIKGSMEIPISALGSTPYFGDFYAVKIIDSSKLNRCNIGLVNRKGKFVIPAELDSLGERSGKYLVIFKQSKAGLIDIEGNLILDTEYKSIMFKNNDTIRVKSFPIWKLHDDNSKNFQFAADSVVTRNSFQYDLFVNGNVNTFNHPRWSEEKMKKEKENISAKPQVSDHYTIIEFKNKYGVQDQECNIVISPVFDSLRYISSDSIYIVYYKKKIGIMDHYGAELLPLSEKFQKIYSFENGRAKVLKDGRYGFIDRLGNLHISPQYIDANDFSENAVGVVIAGKWAFLDKDENIIVQPFYQQVKDFQFGMARVKEKNKWYFVNKEGKKITTTPYDDIQSTIHKKWLLVNNGKFGLADTMGKEMLGPKYEYLEDLGNGFVIVKRLNKWGVLDYKQNFILPIEYDGMEYDQYNNCFLTAINGREEIISLSRDKKKRK